MYVSGYDINEDLKQATESGVDVQIVLVNKEDFADINNPNKWGTNENPVVPNSLSDGKGQLLVPVSTVADPWANHESFLYDPLGTHEVIQSI